jgi:hypothetical protein
MSYPVYPNPQKKSHLWAWIVGAFVLGIIAVCGIGALTIGGAAKQAAHEIPTTAAGSQAAAKPKAASADDNLTAGDYELAAKTSYKSKTIKPGTYTVTTNSGCYWARLKGFGGDLDDIIANGNVMGSQAVKVEVKKTDKGLKLDGDCKAEVGK